MARPRNDSNEPKVRDRMLEAFWLLLETHRLRDITVGMIAEKAHCNRGTFYYHYADIDALVRDAVTSLLIEDRGMPRTVFELMTEAEAGDLLRDAVFDRRFHRFVLIMREGEMGRVDAVVKDVVGSLWQSALCPDGGALEPETLLVIEYATSGMLGLIARIVPTADSMRPTNAEPDGPRQDGIRRDEPRPGGTGPCMCPAPAVVEYLRQISSLSIETICRIQHIDAIELHRRIDAFFEKNDLRLEANVLQLART